MWLFFHEILVQKVTLFQLFYREIGETYRPEGKRRAFLLGYKWIKERKFIGKDKNSWYGREVGEWEISSMIPKYNLPPNQEFHRGIILE